MNGSTALLRVLVLIAALIPAISCFVAATPVSTDPASVADDKEMDEAFGGMSDDPKLSCYFCMKYLRLKGALDENMLERNDSDVCEIYPDQFHCPPVASDDSTAHSNPPNSFVQMCQLYVVNPCSATRESGVINAPFDLFACKVKDVFGKLSLLLTLTEKIVQEMEGSTANSTQIMAKTTIADVESALDLMIGNPGHCKTIHQYYTFDMTKVKRQLLGEARKRLPAYLCKSALTAADDFLDNSARHSWRQTRLSKCNRHAKGADVQQCMDKVERIFPIALSATRGLVHLSGLCKVFGLVE